MRNIASSVCCYSYPYYLHEYKLCPCARTSIIPPSRPGTQPLVMLMCGFFWRSNRNHYLLVLVMRALVSSIHVRTCHRNSINKCTIMIPTAVTWGFFFSKYSLFWDKLLLQFGSNVLPCYILSISSYMKIRRSSAEYRSNYKILRTSRMSRSASSRVHVEVQNG